MINQLVSRNSEILDKSRHHLKILMILIKEAIIQPSDHLQFVSFPFIDTSEYGCFVTFDVLLVDIGMRFPLGHIQTKVLSSSIVIKVTRVFADIAFAFRSIPCFNEFHKFLRRS